MPIVCIINGIQILLQYNEHNPPHFHVRYAEHKAMIEIATASMLEGYLPSKQLKVVQDFAREKKEELENGWELARKGEEPPKIVF